MSQRMWKPLEAGKVKKMDSPPEPPVPPNNTALRTSISAQGNSNHLNRKIIRVKDDTRSQDVRAHRKVIPSLGRLS